MTRRLVLGTLVVVDALAAAAGTAQQGGAGGGQAAPSAAARQAGDVRVHPHRASRGRRTPENGGSGLLTRPSTDRMTIGSGSDGIDLYYFGRAHAGGDAWVVFREVRVLHAGDAFAGKGVPPLDANNGASGVEYPQTIARALE